LIETLNGSAKMPSIGGDRTRRRQTESRIRLAVPGEI